jgi:hypothetical protein
MSNVKERASLLNGSAFALDTQSMKRADAGSSSSGTRRLDVFEIQKALLAACGVDPSGMTRPPPRDQGAAGTINQGSMMRMGQEQQMIREQQPHELMMNQQAMESQRIRTSLNFEARKRLQKMMSSPNLGASNSNLMAVMMHQQQQQQKQVSPKGGGQTLKVFQGMNFGPVEDAGRVPAATNGQPVKNNLSNSAA